MKQKTNKLARFKQWILSVVMHSNSLSERYVVCTNCGNKHKKNTRIWKNVNNWKTHHCPKCNSEDYYYA